MERGPISRASSLPLVLLLMGTLEDHLSTAASNTTIPFIVLVDLSLPPFLPRNSVSRDHCNQLTYLPVYYHFYYSSDVVWHPPHRDPPLEAAGPCATTTIGLETLSLPLAFSRTPLARSLTEECQAPHRTAINAGPAGSSTGFDLTPLFNLPTAGQERKSRGHFNLLAISHRCRSSYPPAALAIAAGLRGSHLRRVAVVILASPVDGITGVPSPNRDHSWSICPQSHFLHVQLFC